MRQQSMFDEPFQPDLSKVQVVSFSGGRTSAYLVRLMEQKRKLEGWPVKFIYMDTGVEHPMTLRFVREVAKFWNIDLTVLQADINPVLGEGNGYTVWSAADIQTRMPALKPWADMLKKYGTPYLGGAFCTDRLKTQVFCKYCNDMFGKGNYQTWLGIRTDEPRRLKKKDGISYLADISDVEKLDILNWWERQPFDLLIPEHLGNCVFCIKKGTAKLAAALKDEPGLQRLWQFMVGKAREVDSRKTDGDVMYRGHLSLEGIATLYADSSDTEIKQALKEARRFDTGSCSESCELDLFSQIAA